MNVRFWQSEVDRQDYIYYGTPRQSFLTNLYYHKLLNNVLHTHCRDS